MFLTCIYTLPDRRILDSNQTIDRNDQLRFIDGWKVWFYNLRVFAQFLVLHLKYWRETRVIFVMFLGSVLLVVLLVMFSRWIVSLCQLSTNELNN